MTYESAAAFGKRVLEVYEELGYVILDLPRSTPVERARLILDRSCVSAADDRIEGGSRT
jgi:predicted ATPase